ncbi:hypothetical protein BH23BAC1_BH23BAC1_24160 [soil metagenome]
MLKGKTVFVKQNKEINIIFGLIYSISRIKDKDDLVRINNIKSQIRSKNINFLITNKDVEFNYYGFLKFILFVI